MQTPDSLTVEELQTTVAEVALKGVKVTKVVQNSLKVTNVEK